MSFTYQRDESAPARLEPGEYRVVIMSAEQKPSKAGKEMIVIGVKPSGADMTIKHYIVEGEYFNRNMTQFFDSFDVEDGNFNLMSWVGAEGAAMLGKDENGYLKVRWFINKEKSASLPQFVGEKPERQKVSSFEELGEDDELPFEI